MKNIQVEFRDEVAYIELFSDGRFFVESSGRVHSWGATCAGRTERDRRFLKECRINPRPKALKRLYKRLPDTSGWTVEPKKMGQKEIRILVRKEASL